MFAYLCMYFLLLWRRTRSSPHGNKQKFATTSHRLSGETPLHVVVITGSISIPFRASLGCSTLLGRHTGAQQILCVCFTSFAARGSCSVLKMNALVQVRCRDAGGSCGCRLRGRLRLQRFQRPSPQAAGSFRVENRKPHIAWYLASGTM